MAPNQDGNDGDGGDQRSPFPSRGRPVEELIAELRTGRGDDADWRGGRTFSLVYNAADAELERLQAAVAVEYLHENYLNPFVFPSLLRMERDVVAMGADLVHGNPRAGKLTSGGTESLFLAVQVARDHAREVRGIADPTPDLAELAAGHGALCHIDACLGGWLLPFLERLGEPVPPWDFRVEGVTSLSADVHKYGWCFKGASLLLHRHEDDLRRQYFLFDGWPAGCATASRALTESTSPATPCPACWRSRPTRIPTAAHRCSTSRRWRTLWTTGAGTSTASRAGSPRSSRHPTW